MATARYRRGMGIRIGPVRLSKRGARVSVGPRIARVHIGAGRTGFSSGVGPVTVSSSGRRRRQVQRQPTRAPSDVTILIWLGVLVALVAVCGGTIVGIRLMQ